MTTLVCNVQFAQTQLFSRKQLFETGYGVHLEQPLSTLEFNLVEDFSFSVQSFVYISTDSKLDLYLQQDERMICTTICGMFLTYAAFSQVIVTRNAEVIRIPKVSILYS